MIRFPLWHIITMLIRVESEEAREREAECVKNQEDELPLSIVAYRRACGMCPCSGAESQMKERFELLDQLARFRKELGGCTMARR